MRLCDCDASRRREQAARRATRQRPQAGNSCKEHTLNRKLANVHLRAQIHSLLMLLLHQIKPTAAQTALYPFSVGCSSELPPPSLERRARQAGRQADHLSS